MASAIKVVWIHPLDLAEKLTKVQDPTYLITEDSNLDFGGGVILYEGGESPTHYKQDPLIPREPGEHFIF